MWSTGQPCLALELIENWPNTINFDSRFHNTNVSESRIYGFAVLQVCFFWFETLYEDYSTSILVICHVSGCFPPGDASMIVDLLTSCHKGEHQYQIKIPFAGQCGWRCRYPVQAILNQVSSDAGLDWITHLFGCSAAYLDCVQVFFWVRSSFLGHDIWLPLAVFQSSQDGTFKKWLLSNHVNHLSKDSYRTWLLNLASLWKAGWNEMEMKPALSLVQLYSWGEISLKDQMTLIPIKLYSFWSSINSPTLCRSLLLLQTPYRSPRELPHVDLWTDDFLYKSCAVIPDPSVMGPTFPAHSHPCTSPPGPWYGQKNHW